MPVGMRFFKFRPDAVNTGGDVQEATNVDASISQLTCKELKHRLLLDAFMDYLRASEAEDTLSANLHARSWNPQLMRFQEFLSDPCALPQTRGGNGPGCCGGVLVGFQGRSRQRSANGSGPPLLDAAGT